MHRWNGSPRFAAVLVAVSLLVAVGPTAAEAAPVHVDCSRQGLQARLNSASAGSTLLISGTCIGNFVVGKPLTLQGSPHATLDGDQAGTTLTITTTKPVHLMNLTIQRGLADHGGGIHAAGGTLTLNHVVVQDSYAIADRAQGGGIWKKGGTLTVAASQIVHDVAFTKSSEPITDAQGGGIFMPAGRLTITGSTVAHDEAVCHTPGQCQTLGGGIDYEGTATRTTITNSHIDDNRAVATGNIAVVAGAGAELLASFTITGSTLNGNVAEGTANRADSQAIAIAGALAGAKPSEPSRISNTTIANNRIALDSKGSNATADGEGAGVEFDGPLTLTGSHITGNRISVESNGQAIAGGGALRVGRLTLTDSTVAQNTVLVHAGPGTATATGGGIDSPGNEPLVITRSTIAGNDAQATSAANNATASGGGVVGPGGTFTMKASTVSGNVGHAEAAGGTASAHAGGVQLNGASANALVQNSTIAANHATSTGSIAFASGGGIQSAAQTVTITNATIATNRSSERGGGLEAAGPTTTTLEATILAGNAAPNGPDCKGTVASAGHNLLGDDTSCSFTAQPSDKRNKPAKLGPLHANGGPTQTMAVLAGSPALNAIPRAACAVRTDQRGVHRPQGSGCEIGAFELQP
ncbi:MAG TPA: choice-of-anchor Q domain-containing protein [Actinomycetota bacterium]|nr:choice-of-anchor Q domain-containing protein [Actinomycetota bacterium]